MTKSSKKAPAKAPAKAAAKPAAKPEKIGKTQMVDLLADKAGLTKKQAAEAIDGLNDIITGALKTGKTVGLPGLGTFSVKETAARQGVRPGTNEKINIPAGKKVSFKVASNLKTEI